LDKVFSDIGARGLNMTTIITGPSGVGKTTLAEAVLKFRPSLHRAVSWTTRSPRPGEKNGRDYHFVTDDHFERAVRGNQFAETAQYGESRYGTLKMDMESDDPNFHVLLVIEVQGTRTIRMKYEKVKTIFVHPPSFGELEKRMDARMAGEPAADRERRLKRAQEEIRCAHEYDYEVVNAYVLSTVQEIVRIIDLPWAVVG
jgi:guanylate kinase